MAYKSFHANELNSSLVNTSHLSNIASFSFIDIFNVCTCTIIVLLGISCNMISFGIFINGKKSLKTKIFTKHLLILLTASNSIYLIFFWYYSVFPRLIGMLNNFKIFENLKSLYFINSNVLICKLTSYLISLVICLNSFITTTFSLQRALVISFPLKFSNFRENNKKIFKMIIFIFCLVSITLPLYILILTNLTKRSVHDTSLRCDIPAQHELLYFNLTICFIIITLPVPFLIILISNASILVVIDRNRRHLSNNRLVNTEKINKSMRITYILLVISTCFVLLNFPYFISWYNYAMFRVNLNPRTGYSENEVKTLAKLYDTMKITEILNLFNYAFIGFLYFVSGKIFRSHLNFVIGLNSLLEKSTLEDN